MKKFIDEFTEVVAHVLGIPEGVAQGLGILFVIWVVAIIIKIFE